MKRSDKLKSSTVTGQIYTSASAGIGMLSVLASFVVIRVWAWI